MEQGTFWDGISKQPHGPRGGSGRGGWRTPAQRQAYMQKRKDNGICAKCSNRRESKSSLCAACLAKANEEAKARYVLTRDVSRERARERAAKKRLDPTEKAKDNMASRERYRRSPEAYRRNDLKRHFGMTVEQYEAMERKQKGLCAICQKPPLVGKRASGKEKQPPRLCVDHDHVTGKVRGLLCHWCNSHIVAGIEKSGATLKQIAEYLGMAL